MTRFVTTDELIYINDQLPSEQPIHKILKGKQKVRDMDLLEAAVGRPMQTVFGAEAYPTLAQKAAALLHSLARNHPFADGNKRTATVGALFMLQVNGLQVNWNAAEALQQIIRMAEGQLTVTDFAAWLPTLPGTLALTEDAVVDTRIIAEILEEHDWLLTELALR